MNQIDSGREKTLWRDRLFVPYWFARTTSLSGTSVTTVILPMLVYQETRSPLLTSMLTAFEVLPYLAFGLVAGVASDRVDRFRLMIGCDLVSGLLVVTLPVAAELRLRSWAHVLIVALALATCFVWFDAANFGAIRSIVGRDRVVSAMSAIWTSEQLANVGGPLLAGLLIVLVGVAQSLFVDTASYFISALLLTVVWRRHRGLQAPASTAAAERSGKGVRSEIADGLRFIWADHLIRAITLSSLGVSIAGGAVVGLLVVFANRALHIAPSSNRIALLFAALAFGAAIASVSSPVLSRRFRAGRLALAGTGMNFVALVCIAASGSLWIVLAPLVAYQFCYSTVTLNGIVLRQMCTPQRLVGRVSTTARMIGWGGMPLGATLGGLLATVLAVRWVLAGMSLLVLAAFLWGLRSDLLTSPVVTGRPESLPLASEA